MAKSISFRSESTKFIPASKRILSAWLEKIIVREKKIPGEICFIYCSDEYLLEINRKYLNHDYFTDVITFDYCEGKTISGDIFISVERVRENANTQEEKFENELHRVMVHGVLHLLGFKDKSKSAKDKMRRKEDVCLKQLVT